MISNSRQDLDVQPVEQRHVLGNIPAPSTLLLMLAVLKSGGSRYLHVHDVIKHMRDAGPDHGHKSLASAADHHAMLTGLLEPDQNEPCH